MRASWLGYNEAVQNSEQRELLLNLVRLRYTDAPEFLGISSISTQMSFQAGASIGGDFGNVENSNSAFVSPDIFVGYSETPTITFTPLRNQEFARQLVAPVELDSLYLLTQYGWGIDRVFRLIVNDLNGQCNEITREDPDALSSESIRGFLEIASRLRQLEEKNLIGIGIEQRREVLSAGIPRDHVSSDDILNALEAGYRLDYQEEFAEYFFTVDRSHFVLAVDERAWDNPEFADIARLLGLPPRQTTYEIDPGPIDFEKLNGHLSVTTRSVLGTMAYLSNAVSVPESHQRHGLASSNDNVGSTLSDILEIRVSATPVENAYVSILYKDFWYYIAANDIASRRTLGLLTSLMRLTIGAGGAQNVPVLTLPVSS